MSVEDQLNNGVDLSSFANCDEVFPKSIDLDWTVDFDAKVFRGSATLTFTVLSSSATTVVLDSRALSLNGDVTVNGTVVKAEIAEEVALGNKFTIELPVDDRVEGKEIVVVVPYITSSDATAIQWLSPEATADKTHPFVFTQAQAIHARSMLPCMDSPGLKVPYSAKVTAPKWCTILMSAVQEGSPVEVDADNHVVTWKQSVATSTYLIALAGGSLASEDISDRVRVWSEPSVIKKAAYEFAETEEFVQAAEKISGVDYVWGRYDVICLPPSFPYGGMENPCLTFATPTLLAGDRSLADVIAHEIAHSWTGNLVTNKTWTHFWLNEGWTVWFERKITGYCNANKEDASLLSAQIGFRHLEEDVEHMKRIGLSKFTSLVWPSEAADPDDAFSGIPYEKGFNLLNELETIVSTPVFLSFFNHYLKTFGGKTVTTSGFRDTFVNFVAGKISAEAAEQIENFDWEQRFLGEGMPVRKSDFSNRLSTEVNDVIADVVNAFKTATSPADVKIVLKKESFQWSSQQLCLFLDNLIKIINEEPEDENKFSSEGIEQLDNYFQFNSSGNTEVRYRWLMLNLQFDSTWPYAKALELVSEQGRMKFVRPLYRALKDHVAGTNILEEYKVRRNTYHPVARKMIDFDLGFTN